MPQEQSSRRNLSRRYFRCGVGQSSTSEPRKCELYIRIPVARFPSSVVLSGMLIQDSLEQVQQLLNEGMDLTPSSKGVTLFHLAALCGHLQVMD